MIFGRAPILQKIAKRCLWRVLWSSLGVLWAPFGVPWAPFGLSGAPPLVLKKFDTDWPWACLLYTSDAADD